MKSYVAICRKKWSKKIGVILFLLTISTFCIAQTTEIITAIIGNNLVYYLVEDGSIKAFPLSNQSIANELPRSMEYNPDLCEFYVITSFRSKPKISRISPTGEVNMIGELKMNDGKNIYSCDAIAFDEVSGRLYASISYDNLDYYTETLVSVNTSSAVCTEVSNIATNGSYSDMDYLECYNGSLLIGDVDNAPFFKIYKLDLNSIPQNSIPIEIYHDNLTTSDNQKELAVIGDFLFVENNKQLLKANLTENPLNFTLAKSINVPGLIGPIISMASFPYGTIFGINKQNNIDTTICEGDTLFVDRSTYQTFSWNDGNTQLSRNLTLSGTYYGVGEIGDCTILSDTIILKTKTCNKCEDYYEEIQYYLQLGRDIEMCYGEFYSIVLPRIIDTVFWNDGSQGRAKHLLETATLSAIVKVDSCIFYSDTIQITFVNCDDCNVYFPDAFTPNNDGINNIFNPVYNEACNFRFETFEVYDRWGEKLFESKNANWNGMYKNLLVQPGTYYYFSKVKDLNRGVYKIYSGPIHVLY